MARILPGLVRNRSKAVPAIVAAVLFGLATPAIKIELLVSNPVALATFLYLGAGTGIFVVSITKSRPGCFAGIRRSLLSESAGLAGTIIIGGILAPVIQFTALSITPAATASLLLNFEIIATLPWLHGAYFTRTSAGPCSLRLSQSLPEVLSCRWIPLPHGAFRSVQPE